MEKFQLVVIRFIRKYRFAFLFLLFILITYLIICLRDLKIDNSLQVWFPKEDPSYIRYKNFLHSFGSDEVVVTLITDSIPINDPVRLEKTDELCKQIQSIAGIERTMCITNIPLMMVEERLISIGEILYDSVMTAQAQKKLEHWPENRLLQRFIGKDSITLVLYSWMDTLSVTEKRRGEILHSIDSLSRASLICHNGKIDHGGVGVIYDALNTETVSESPFMIGLSYCLIMGAVFYFTRKLYWVLISGLVVTLSNITVFGIMALTGQPVNMISVAIPPLIMVTGVATVVHVARYTPDPNREIPYQNHYILSVLILLSFPLLFNALTTAGGFLSLLTASMKITRLYGVFAALGVMSSLVYSYLLIVMFTGEKMTPLLPSGQHNWIRKKVKSLILFSMVHRNAVIVISFLLASISLFGIVQLNLDTKSFEFLSKKSPVREQSSNIEAQIGHYMPFDFVISYRNRNWKHRDFLLKLNRLQDTIEQDHRFGTTYSIADVVLEAYSLYYGKVNVERSALETLSQQQIVYFASRIQRTEAFAPLVADKGKQVRLTVTGPIVSARTMMSLAKEIEHMAQTVFDDTIIINPSGYLPMYSRLVDRLLHDQVVSISVAMIVVFTLIGLFFKSWRFLLIAIPSNILPILVILGIMGYSGIFIDTATVTMAAAIIGIIVDDTIHILYTLKEKTQYGSSLELLATHLTDRTGEAVVYTSIILCAGFSIIGISSARSISTTGWLTALTIAFALIADLMLLPAVAYYGIIKKRFKNVK